jgi:DNA polymerase III delta subunit
MSDMKIQKELGMPIWQVKNLSMLTSNISINRINHLINDLFLLDYNIKMDKINPYLKLKSIIFKNVN